MFGRNHEPTINERAEDILDDAAKGLNELGREARKRADSTKKDVSKQLYTVANSLRREARERGASKEVRTSVDDVAKGLERAGHYLKKHSYEDMGEDVTKVVQRNPMRTLAIVFIVGLVIGLLMRGDDDNRGQYNA